MKPKARRSAKSHKPLTVEQAARALGRTALSRSMTLEEGVAAAGTGARRAARQQGDPSDPFRLPLIKGGEKGIVLGQPDPLRSPQALAGFRRRKGVRILRPNTTPRFWRDLRRTLLTQGDEAMWDVIKYIVPRTGPEARFRTRLVHALRAQGYWVTVTHGGPFQAGLPDIVGCVDGTFVGIELKARKVKSLKSLHIGETGGQKLDEPFPTPSDLQAAILGDIESARGRGLVAVCISEGTRNFHYQLWRKKRKAPISGGWIDVWAGPSLDDLVDHVRRQVQVEATYPQNGVPAPHESLPLLGPLTEEPGSCF